MNGTQTIRMGREFFGHSNHSLFSFWIAYDIGKWSRRRRRSMNVKYEWPWARARAFAMKNHHFFDEFPRCKVKKLALLNGRISWNRKNLTRYFREKFSQEMRRIIFDWYIWIMRNAQKWKRKKSKTIKQIFSHRKMRASLQIFKLQNQNMYYAPMN